MNSSKVQAIFESGKSRYQIGDYKRAIEELQEAVEAEFNTEEAYKLIASSYYKIHEYDKSREFYSQYLSTQSDDIDATVDSALCLFNLGEFDDCIEILDGVLMKEPNCSVAILNRAFAKFTIKDFEGASLDFNRVVEISKSGELDQEIKNIASKHIEFDEEAFRQSIWIYASICESGLNNLNKAKEYSSYLTQSGNLVGDYLNAYYALLEKDKQNLKLHVEKLYEAFKQNNDINMNSKFEKALSVI